MPVCFWTDLVNTEQGECGGGGGGGGDGNLSYAGPPGNCGSSIGRLVLFTLSDDDMDAELENALNIATEVTLTGVYQDAAAVDDFENEVGDEVPGYVEFVTVSYPMTFSGFYGAFATGDVEELDATLGAWYRVDVDGIIYYAAAPLTTAC